MANDDSYAVDHVVAMFTDLVDSVAMQEVLGTPAYAELLREHDRLLSEAIEAFSGQVANDTGDGRLVMFRTASDGVEAALRFHMLLQHGQWPVEAPSIRIGLAQGQVRIKNPNSHHPILVGRAVNISARVLDSAGSGQIMMTRTIYDDAKLFIDEHPGIKWEDESHEVEWKIHGLYCLKGIDTPVEIVEVRAKNSPALVVPPDQGKATRILGRASGQTETLEKILRPFNLLLPLLHKLGEPLKLRERKKFLSGMRRFFHGVHLLNEEVDQDLLNGTDNLLRVLDEVRTHQKYRYGKLVVARNAFEYFRKRADEGIELAEVTGDRTLAENCRQIRLSLALMVEGSDQAGVIDDLLLRLVLALLDYGSLQGTKKNAYPELSPAIHQSLRDFLNVALSIGFNTNLPDTLDNSGIDSMHSYSQSAWDTMSD